MAPAAAPLTVRAQTKSVGGPPNREAPVPTNNLRPRNTNHSAQKLGRSPADRVEYALHRHHTAANTRLPTFPITTPNFKFGLTPVRLPVEPHARRESQWPPHRGSRPAVLRYVA